MHPELQDSNAEKQKKYLSTTNVLKVLIQPQDYNDKHDASGDENINRVVDLYFKICIVFMLLASYLIPQFYL